ncbi:hypothetical protein BDC45DRAFT_540812 [Circinella umbellata]|nr:hypothetical protein BDC45DRAFT_540812 [Circinella umbellata]
MVRMLLRTELILTFLFCCLVAKCSMCDRISKSGGNFLRLSHSSIISLYVAISNSVAYFFSFCLQFFQPSKSQKIGTINKFVSSWLLHVAGTNKTAREKQRSLGTELVGTVKYLLPIVYKWLQFTIFKSTKKCIEI